LANNLRLFAEASATTTNSTRKRCTTCYAQVPNARAGRNLAKVLSV
jgi:hypothetical protein